VALEHHHHHHHHQPVALAVALETHHHRQKMAPVEALEVALPNRWVVAAEGALGIIMIWMVEWDPLQPARKS
jgi:hypothetical protein